MFKVLFRNIPIKLTITIILASIATGILNGYITDAVMLLINDNIGDKFWVYFTAVCFVIISFTIVDLAHGALSVRWFTSISNAGYEDYFKRLYDIKPEVLKKSNTGYISGVLNKFNAHREVALEMIVISIPVEMSFAIFACYRLCQIHWSFGVTAMVLIIIGNVVRVIISSTIEKDLAKDFSDAEGERNKLFSDVVSNIGTVQKMRVIDFFMVKAKETFDEALRRGSRWIKWNRVAVASSRLGTYGLISVVLILVWYVGKSRTYSQYEFLIIGSMITKLPYNARAISKSIEKYIRWAGSASKLEEICNEGNKRKPIFDGNFNRLKIMNVDYSYQDSQSNQKVTIGIPNFEIERGDFVCIYGESGQGKTTLLNILSGEIETGDTVINDYVTDKRLECVFISQDTEIFDMSLWDNLTLGVPCDWEYSQKVRSYIDAVGLSEWFERQSKGFNTILGERGVFVSTGQRQRLNLVRGLLRDGKEVYLLDEPTSNVDGETEAKMIHLIKNVLRDKTVVCVTHRPQIKELANKIYKFEDGVLRRET